jgi:hypothetical protein
MGKHLLAVGAVAVLSSLVTGCNASNAVNTLVFLDAGPSEPVAPDGGAYCVGQCNYQTQQGCDAGQMCYPALSTDGTVSPQCIASGTLDAGESCSGLQCKAGYVCADGYCRHMCCGRDWSVCAPNESCTGQLQLQPPDAGGVIAAGASLCLPADSCDVLDPNSCGAGQSCYIVDSRGDVLCLTTGTAAYGEACTTVAECGALLTCVKGSNGKATCRRLCRAVAGGGTPGCPAAENTYCSHFAQDPAGVGECTPLQ